MDRRERVPLRTVDQVKDVLLHRTVVTIIETLSQAGQPNNGLTSGGAEEVNLPWCRPGLL